MKFILTLVMAALSCSAAIANDSDEDPRIIDLPPYIPLKPQKRIPSIHRSYLSVSDGEACFHTTQPYAFATIVVTDDADEVVGSMIVSPDDNCGNLELYPGCTITCTFDNGATLSAIY